MSKKEKKTTRTREEFAMVKTIKEVKETCRQTVRDYNENYLKTVMNTGREFGRNLKQTGNDLKQGLKKTGREFGESAKKDARTLADRVARTAKESVPGVSTIEAAGKKIKDGVQAVAGRVNLPTRSDMDRLNQAMETLGGKVEMLTGK